MNTINVVCIKTASSICFTGRMKPFFLVSQWEGRKAESAERTNYNGINLVGIIDAWKAGELEQARELQNFSQEVINVICHFRGEYCWWQTYHEAYRT